MEINSLKIAFLSLITIVTLSSCGQQTEDTTVNPLQTQSLLNGKLLYKQYCVACHQADGAGVPKINPPLANTVYVTGDKLRLAKILLRGMDGRVEINGKFYSNRMPSFKYLSDKEIADILSFIRNDFGNRAGFVQAAEVNTARKLSE